MATGRYDAELARHQAAVGKSVSQQRDIEPEEMVANFSLEDIQALDLYQKKQSEGTFSCQAISITFRNKYPETADLLSDNTMTYEDDIEDALVEDPVITSIMATRKTQPQNMELSAAIRARRSVVMFILHECFSADTRPRNEGTEIASTQDVA